MIAKFAFWNYRGDYLTELTIKGGWRTFPLKVFPYSVIYCNLKSGLRILILSRQHRKPSHAGGGYEAYVNTRYFSKYLALRYLHRPLNSWAPASIIPCRARGVYCSGCWYSNSGVNGKFLAMPGSAPASMAFAPLRKW